jgi:hypothetical protein
MIVLHRDLTICSCSCQDCAGAIGGTHVIPRVLRSESRVYGGHYRSQNMLANIDFDIRLIHAKHIHKLWYILYDIIRYMHDKRGFIVVYIDIWDL